MLWVSVPWGLTPVHLLELQDVTPLLRYQFSRGVRLLGRGDLAPALATVDQLSEVAAAQRDRYASALALVVPVVKNRILSACIEEKFINIKGKTHSTILTIKNPI